MLDLGIAPVSLKWILVLVFIISVGYQRLKTKSSDDIDSNKNISAKSKLKSNQKIQDVPLGPSDIGREFGQWSPVDFELPVPPAYPEWSIEHTKPIAYRPFKHKFFVTMGLRRLNFNDWIELDNEFPKFHKRKIERLESEHGPDLWHLDEDDDGRTLAAVEEFLDALVEYLVHRYPSLYEKTDQGLRNLHTKEDFDLVSRPWKENPMVICSKLVQDDLAVMIEGKNGQYYLKAGAVILAGFWRLKDKVNKSLRDIHLHGEVPEFNKLQNSMEKFFLRLKVDEGVVRHNYYIQIDDDIAWSKVIGPEDSDDIGWNSAKPATDASKLFFRTERQTVRRLPQTGAIVFTFRTYFVPLSEICKEPHVPHRLLDGINSWPEDTAIYKGLEKYKDVIIPYLEEEARIQAARGYTKETETLNFPY